MTARARPSDSSLLCSEPGCCNRWTSNYGRRYCSEHNPGLSGHAVQRPQSTLPFIAAAPFKPHWSDTDREQEAEF
jgi:hypothetical protein